MKSTFVLSSVTSLYLSHQRKITQIDKGGRCHSRLDSTVCRSSINSAPSNNKIPDKLIVPSAGCGHGDGGRNGKDDGRRGGASSRLITNIAFDYSLAIRTHQCLGTGELSVKIFLYGLVVDWRLLHSARSKSTYKRAGFFFRACLFCYGVRSTAHSFLNRSTLEFVDSSMPLIKYDKIRGIYLGQ